MWKWIGGCAVVVVVGVLVLGYVGYRQVKEFTAAGGNATVTIAGTPERVFASMADADSVRTWMSVDSVSGGRHGPLQVGDTLRFGPPTGQAKGQTFVWVVTEVRPGALLAMSMHGDQMAGAMGSRRDSLVAAGDSTRILTTISSPMMDSLSTVAGDSAGNAGSALMDVSAKMMLSGMRMAVEADLAKLKARIEGKRAPADTTR